MGNYEIKYHGLITMKLHGLCSFLNGGTKKRDDLNNIDCVQAQTPDSAIKYDGFLFCVQFFNIVYFVSLSIKINMGSM